MGRQSYDRIDRVNQQILEVLSRVILREVRDPRLQTVQLTAVEASPDLRYAKVYYVLMDEREDSQRVRQGLESSAGFLRRELSKAVRLKHVPELDFTYDESIERGRRMEKILSGLHEEE